MSQELRSIFEAIIRAVGTPGNPVYIVDTPRIVALAERGISLLSHSKIEETKPPYWEEHDREPRWMMSIGVEGDRFNPHLEDSGCKESGCRPAFPKEIPRRTT